jgi:hypothetical protein
MIKAVCCRLIEDGICTEKNVPSISSINRIIRDKRGGGAYHIYNNSHEVSVLTRGILCLEKN